MFNVSSNIIGVGNPDDLPLWGIPMTLAYWLDYGNKYRGQKGSLKKTVILGRQFFNCARLICCIANVPRKANGRKKLNYYF